MSTDIGSLKNSGSRNVDLSLNRFWGGDENGVCVQITGKMEDGGYGYVQLSAYDLITLLPILKEHIIDAEMNRVKADCEESIERYKELRKTIVSDMREVAKFVLDKNSADLINLTFGKEAVFEFSDELTEQDKVIKEDL